MKITNVYGREVIDSRGNPTVEVEIAFADGAMGRAIVPSGASTGVHEVLELRDGDPKRFFGKGCLQAVSHVNGAIKESIEGKEFASLRALDEAMIQLDGTPQKSKLGANAILGVSLAAASALAYSEKKPYYRLLNETMGRSPSDMRMPVPLMNIINGGEHANNPLEIQEFMIVPHGFGTFAESLRAGCEVFQQLKKTLHDLGHSTAVGDEGGFAPNLESNEHAIEVICEAIEKTGYKPGTDISLALDVAASSFYDGENKCYKIKLNNKPTATASELLDFYATIIGKYPIVSIEDGLDENDWANWAPMTEKFSNKVQLVGDDLFVTNRQFVERGIKEKVANSVLIKVNQIGSLTETIDTMNLCKENKYSCVVSHRSGETEDVTIAHLAVGSGCGQIKTGSLSRGERTAKYNELLRIEDGARRAGSPIPMAKVF